MLYLPILGNRGYQALGGDLSQGKQCAGWGLLFIPIKTYTESPGISRYLISSQIIPGYRQQEYDHCTHRDTPTRFLVSVSFFLCANSWILTSQTALELAAVTFQPSFQRTKVDLWLHKYLWTWTSCDEGNWQLVIHKFRIVVFPSDANPTGS